MSRTAWRLAPNPSDALRHLRSLVSSVLPRLDDPEPRFTYQIAWSGDYDSLFRNDSTDVTDVSDLWRRAKRSGRVTLCARGGGAKTVILHRLAKIAFEAGDVPVLLDLKKWTEPTYKHWMGLREDGLERASYLLAEFSAPRITLSELEALPADTPRVILIDGLNEVRLSSGNSILSTIDTFVRRSINTCAIVADRLVRRDLPNPERWQLATIQPLSDREIRRHVKTRFSSTAQFDGADEQTRSLLSTPYFLNYLLNEGRVASSGSQAFRDYFMRHVSLTGPELNQAALAAFRAYSDDQTRVFSVQAFEQDSGDIVWQKIRDAGAVVTKDGRAYFTHHLKHDYLASVYVCGDSSRWEPGVFMVVSLGASSFDGIALALEQLQVPEDADLFARRVYDWNPYAAAYAVAEGLGRLSARVTDEMQVVLLAMLAERRWDLINATSQRATDAMSIFPESYATRFLHAPTLAVIFAFINGLQTDKDWFESWRELFTRPTGTPATNADLELLRQADSIIGWTAANVLKRLTLDNHQLQLLRGMLPGADATTKWRIVHVLGAFPSQENAEALRTAMRHEPNEWVRYGAIRSLVELAAVAESPTLRRMIFDQLASDAHELLADRRRLEEFERAIFIRRDKAPDDWIKTAGSVLEALYEECDEVERRDRWARLANELITKYS